MKKWNLFLAFKIFALVLILGMGSSILGKASEDETKFEQRDGEIIFLLDTSNSMNVQDRDRMTIDALRQAVYSMPSNWKAGMVAYNTDIQSSIPLESTLEQWESELDTLEYSGYTNAGEGLQQAMEMFSDKDETSRYIVMFTDGEIDMPDSQEKEKSRKLYEEMTKLARDEGIKIFIVAVGSELDDPQMHIFDGAEVTDGAIYWEGQSGSLSEIVFRILCDRINFPHNTIGVTDGNGGSVYFEMPSQGAEHLKICITSGKGLQNVSADYTAETGRIVSGKNFAVVDIGRPVDKGIKVRFETLEISDVNAYVITEYETIPKTEITYRREETNALEETEGKETEKIYEHYADIRIRLEDSKGKNDNLWNQPCYEGKEIPFWINGILTAGTIKNGEIQHSVKIDGIDQLTIELDTGSMAERFVLAQPIEIILSPPPDPVPEKPDYRPLWITLGIMAAAMLLILILWVKKSRTTVIYVAKPAPSRESAEKLETKSCVYTGKLNMYVVQTETGRDIPPQTYRLFGRQSVRMSLNQILVSCGIKFGKIGAEDIIFYPGPDKALIIMDQSEKCTVLRGTEILKKGMGYPVYFNEKVTVSFEDEVTEMEIHYKNLKPGEMDIQ